MNVLLDDTCTFKLKNKPLLSLYRKPRSTVTRALVCNELHWVLRLVQILANFLLGKRQFNQTNGNNKGVISRALRWGFYEECLRIRGTESGRPRMIVHHIIPFRGSQRNCLNNRRPRLFNERVDEV